LHCWSKVSPTWRHLLAGVRTPEEREGDLAAQLASLETGERRLRALVARYGRAKLEEMGRELIAYTARDDASSRFDIVTIDLTSGKMTRITQGQGNNEEPTWSPGGRVIAFSSDRPGGSGIYLANADGTGPQTLVHKGSGTSADWGPAPAQ
jgi:TolB protein